MIGEITGLRIGEVVQMDGRWVKYLGSGQFAPAQAPELIIKRFDTADSGPLITRRDA
jgi:hypothetical protein